MEYIVVISLAAGALWLYSKRRPVAMAATVSPSMSGTGSDSSASAAVTGSSPTYYSSGDASNPSGSFASTSTASPAMAGTAINATTVTMSSHAPVPSIAASAPARVSVLGRIPVVKTPAAALAVPKAATPLAKQPTATVAAVRKPIS
jgi:hypothetical protein